MEVLREVSVKGLVKKPKDANEMAGADAGWSDAREQTETFLLDTGFHSHL